MIIDSNSSHPSSHSLRHSPLPRPRRHKGHSPPKRTGWNNTINAAYSFLPDRAGSVDSVQRHLLMFQFPLCHDHYFIQRVGGANNFLMSYHSRMAIHVKSHVIIRLLGVNIAIGRWYQGGPAQCNCRTRNLLHAPNRCDRRRHANQRRFDPVRRSRRPFSILKKRKKIPTIRVSSTAPHNFFLGPMVGCRLLT